MRQRLTTYSQRIFMSNFFVDAIKNYKIENNERRGLIVKTANEFLNEEGMEQNKCRKN